MNTLINLRKSTLLEVLSSCSMNLGFSKWKMSHRLFKIRTWCMDGCLKFCYLNPIALCTRLKCWPWEASSLEYGICLMFSGFNFMTEYLWIWLQYLRISHELQSFISQRIYLRHNWTMHMKWPHSLIINYCNEHVKFQISYIKYTFTTKDTQYSDT